MLTLVITTFISASCNNSKKEDTKQHEGHHHNEEKVHPEAYICPVNCNKGKTLVLPGKCVVCKLDLVEQEHTIGDGHDYPIKKLNPTEKKSNSSKTDIEQLY